MRGEGRIGRRGWKQLLFFPIFFFFYKRSGVCGLFERSVGEGKGVLNHLKDQGMCLFCIH